ncbi:Atu4866 domain-containing protein [Luteimonas kalidii]|uniref:Atu4866 domain-containing protein n=1 Tax=Luteimonas kalidii TaxID=3042025 RepID=A0ABT6JQ47_9GAMM|nr:Atu4866 domain-containing protein [Luteimonas kalidii]MDH5832809.1 Atu4866 domain-containing protein [Luteimonas kalidii]
MMRSTPITSAAGRPTDHHASGHLPDRRSSTGPTAADDAIAAGSVVGTWTNDDGFVRLVLCADGRYEEARGSRTGVYRGRYALRGARIEYLDDSGFFAFGELIDDSLHHGGMVLRRAAGHAAGADDPPPRGESA